MTSERIPAKWFILQQIAGGRSLKVTNERTTESGSVTNFDIQTPSQECHLFRSANEPPNGRPRMPFARKCIQT